jgi:hypothetical protein
MGYGEACNPQGSLAAVILFDAEVAPVKLRQERHCNQQFFVTFGHLSTNLKHESRISFP